MLDAADQIQVVLADALTWAENPAGMTYDIAFIDPPFNKNLAEKACCLLVKNGYLRQNALVYVESEPGLVIETEMLRQVKHKQAGQVQYQLLKYNNNSG